jgi:hypothetical protein
MQLTITIWHPSLILPGRDRRLQGQIASLPRVEAYLPAAQRVSERTPAGTDHKSVRAQEVTAERDQSNLQASTQASADRRKL